MHLSCVFSCFSQDINDLSYRIFCLFGPFYNFHNRFVPILSTFQLIFRDKNIICQSAVLGQQKGVEFLYFQCADKSIVGTFQNLYHFTFRVPVLTFGKEGYFYFVIIHGMCRITFGYENGFSTIIGDEGVLAVAFTLKDASHNQAVVVQLVVSFFYFLQKIILNHFSNDVGTKHFKRMCSKVQTA